MDAPTCDNAQLTRPEAAPRTVGDVMVKRPKTLAASATVAEARHFFDNPKVIAAPVVDGAVFVGILEREDLPAALPDTAPARDFARRAVPTVTPDQPMQDALDVLDAEGTLRLVVLGDDGQTLAGLLCLDLQRSGFCEG